MPDIANYTLDALLPGVLAVARAAGQAIAQVYARTDLGIETKADQSPLTAADRAAHEVIAAGLARLAPAIPLWSEESARIDWETRRHWTEFWLVDPLDGTKEFIQRNGEFTVNIALIRGHRSVLGVVHAPVLKRDYYGCAGGGAFRADEGSPGKAASGPDSGRAASARGREPLSPGLEPGPHPGQAGRPHADLHGQLPEVLPGCRGRS